MRRYNQIEARIARLEAMAGGGLPGAIHDAHRVWEESGSWPDTYSGRMAAKIHAAAERMFESVPKADDREFL